MRYYGSVLKGLEKVMGLSLALGGATQEKLKANGIYFNGVFKYLNEFMTPFWIALNSFTATERDKIVRHTPQESHPRLSRASPVQYPGGTKRL